MRFFIISIFVFICCNCHNVSASTGDNELLGRLYIYSSQNLNYSTSIPEDSIINICEELQPKLESKKDYETLFRVNQIMVNAYCLKGHIGMAINKATQMYEEAKKLNFNLGIVLSLQALGNAYMYSNRYDQANDVFAEAIDDMTLIESDIVKIRLLLQHLYVCLKTEDINIEKIENSLNTVNQLLSKIEESEEKQNYILYYLKYKLNTHLHLKDTVNAEETYRTILNTKSSVHLTSRLRHAITSFYHMSKGDLHKALLYQDSTILTLMRGDYNISEYIGLLKNKAAILYSMDKQQDAYLIYARINTLNDSLDVTKYTSLMDTLHMNLWVDQMQLKASDKTNKLLANTILIAILALSIIAVMVTVIKKQNRLLQLSRKQIKEENDRVVNSVNSKSMFLSNMSHEIRTPLNGIVGFSQLLATCDDLDAETKKDCKENIRQNSDLLLKLLNDVIDLSDLENSEMSFSFGDYDAVSICRNIIQTVKAAKETSAEVTFVSQLDTLLIRTDRERLQQVLINLLINAIKFTSDGSVKLLLDVDPESLNAIFTVEDTGCGIPKEKQPGIFNRFEKLNENAHGTGLGLSICWLIIEHVGGKIWIDSEYTQGAKFMFTHPLNNNMKKEQ